MNTGRSLAELPAEMMLCVVYYKMLDHAETMTEEVAKARERVREIFRKARFERETGMPSVAMMGVMPADYKPGDPSPFD